MFVGPALLPGKTLSSSDALWFEPPWVGVKPAGARRGPSNPELGDAPQLRPAVPAADRRRGCPHVPLWNPYIVGGRPFQANVPVGGLRALHLPAYVLPFWTALAGSAC